MRDKKGDELVRREVNFSKALSVEFLRLRNKIIEDWSLGCFTSNSELLVVK